MSEEQKEVKDEQENTARSEAMAVLEMGGPDIASAPADGDDKAKGKKPKRSLSTLILLCTGIPYVRYNKEKVMQSVLSIHKGPILKGSGGP